MIIRSSSALARGLVALTVFAGATVAASRADAATISDQASCQTVVPGAGWDGATCAIPPGTTLTINSGDFLVIAVGVGLYNQGTIAISPSAFLLNYGSLLNNGTIANDHGAIINYNSFVNDSAINNSGGIDNFCTWFGGALVQCNFYNHGTITNSAYGGLRNLCNRSAFCQTFNFGTIDNSGSIDVTCAGVDDADKCNNVFFNYNYLINKGNLTVERGGIFQNGGYGVDLGPGTLDNYASVRVLDDIFIGPYAHRLANFGTINNWDYFFVNYLAEFDNSYHVNNHGWFEVDGYLVNGGQIISDCGAPLHINPGGFSGVPITRIPCPVDSTVTTIDPGSVTVSAFSNQGVQFAVTVSDATTPVLTAPTGTLTLSDGGAGGFFYDTAFDQIDSCSPSGWVSLTPISTTASQCQFVYIPSSNATGGNVITITASYQGDGSHSASSGVAGVTVQRTPEQALQFLVGQVRQIGQGQLTGGQVNSLVSKLTNTIAKLAGGQNKAAVNQLGALLNEVNALVKSNILTQAQGSYLAGQIGAIVAALS